MSYRLQTNETLSAGIKRIATEQIDRALRQLTEAPEGKDEAVHDARKRFKKVRAVLRLVRDEIGHDVYKKENVCYRDAGRRLSDVRDSVVMIETLDDLTEYFGDQLLDEAFIDVRESLADAHKATKQRILEQENAIDDVIETIENARRRVGQWPVENDDFSALADGLQRVYKRGYKRMAEAYAQPEPEKFHEWRKRVKYLWYHTRILRPIWSPMQKELADLLHDLSNYLGDHHDLTELKSTVLDQPEIFNDQQELQALLALIDRRRVEFERRARPLGERIYAEKPAAFVKRMDQYWQVYQNESG